MARSNRTAAAARVVQSRLVLFLRHSTGRRNVSFEGSPWTNDIRHGGLLRTGYDQTLEIEQYRDRPPFNTRLPGSSR